MTETKNNDERFPEVKPTKPGNDTAYIAPIIGKLGYDTRRPWLFGLGTSPNNGVDFHVFLSFDGLNFDDNDIDKIWNGGTADRVKKEVDSATAEIPAAVSAANSAVSAAESAVAASKVNSDAIAAQSEAISEAKSAMDSATAEIQQTAANAASDAAKIRADVARVQNEVDTAKAANSASVEALKSDVSAAKQDLADVHDSLTKAQSAVEQNQKLINDSVAKISSDVSATKQDLATVHDSLTKAQAAAEQNQKAIDKNIAQINDSVDATNQDLAGVRKDLTKAQSDITANQKSINNNVAQINSDIAQDRKDIASAQQANADTAKQLDDYSKQATEQGKTIKTIQDKQDGFTATLADVQGNVSQVSDKVDGLSANLKDAQDNVASVKAQADQLSATLTDHAKSIATLTASAKELSSTLEDADGRLSKVEQTAQTNSSTLADMQGDLSQVKQDATTLTATLKDAQGNISTLQQKADSVSAQLASAQGDIATLQTGVAGVKATLASHDKTIHTLQLDSKSLKDSMADAQGDISALSKTATSLDSEMKDHAGRLSKVEQSAATQATTLSDLQGNLSQVKQQADGLVTTLKDAQGDITQIQQKADGTLAQLKSAQGDIASLQTNITGIKATLVSHEGDIHTLQADSRMLKDDMKDAQGNISSLQKSSTRLDSEMSSQDGRLSKVEQTAKEHTTTISNLGDKLSNLKVGGRNLVQNTGQDIVLDDTANAKENGWYYANISLTQQPKVGDQLTISAEGTLTGKGDLSAYQIDLYNANTTDKRSNDAYLAPGKRSSATLTVNNLTGSGDTVLIIYAGKWGDTEGKKLVLYHLKVEFGNVTTDWTPAPEDLATVTQVKQTADGIETTLKSAQGDIDQIKQTAKGTSEQLADVQGNVTNIQKDIDGLKQTTADNAGNIHTLQSDSKSLHDSMQDAQGDISTLKKTSTDVTSELKDHAGRISKAEQTASTLVNEFADQQGHLNRVEQTAQGTQQTVANQQGQINTIKTDASGIHETLTGQGNQIANINVTLNGLNTKYEGVSGDLNKLKSQAQWVTVTSAVDLNNVKTPCHEFLKGTVTNAPNETAWWYLTVESSDDGNRVTQTVIADQSNNRYTRRWADVWSAWVKDATQTDFTALSNRITTNSTQITQNKQAIFLKADQSTVSNLSGQVSQAQAQLKVQAGQISSKVSSTDFKTLDDKVNGMKIGGRNLLIGTSTDEKSGKSYNFADYQISGGLKPNTTYTLSGWARVDQKAIDNNQNVFVCANSDDWQWSIWLNITKSLTSQYGKVTFTTPSGKELWNHVTVYLSHPNGDSSQDSSSGQGFISKLKLEEGNVATDWTPAPEDTITAIQKNSTAIDQTNKQISLKADQTEVNQIKNTATQNSSRLNVMANEISSKVTSTDVNNIVDKKGYATTSTVQSLITQKAGTINESITSLDAKYNATVTQVQSLTASIDGLQSTVANKADKSQITQLSNVIQSKVSSSDFNDLKDKTLWKSTDSIDLNNAVSQQKIFVKGGSNLPPGDYWWYVQVESGYYRRIVQYAVSDRDNIHYSRQYDGSKWSAWSQGAAESEITQLRDDINLRVKSGDLLSQINIQAGRTLIQSQKIYMDADSVIMGPNTKAFIPAAAIINIDADKINTGILNGIEIRQVNTNGRTIDIENGNISISSNDVVEPRLSFINKGAMTKAFNAIGDLETLDQHFMLFNFKPSDTQSMHPISYFTVNNVGDKGSGNAQIQFDHAMLTGHEWWANFDGITFGRSYDGINGSNDYVELYAKSFLPHSQLSSKTRIEKLDGEDAMNTIKQVQMYTYQFKDDVRDGKTKRYASLIIDDVHDVAQYTEPDIFVADNKKCRDDGTQLAYAIAAIQYQQHEIEELKVQLKEKKANE